MLRALEWLIVYHPFVMSGELYTGICQLKFDIHTPIKGRG